MANERKALFHFGYRRSPDQDSAKPAQHGVVIVGAGPVGLSMAIDLAQRGVPSVLLDDADRIGEGSRGLCYSKRTLEILDRLGVGEKLVAMGVTWKLGKVFLGNRLVYSFDLLPEDGHKMPAFINLQQYYLEKALVDRVQELPQIDLRWRNRVSGIARRNDGVTLTVETPDGPYKLDAQWAIAADGARSTMRDLLGLEFRGHTFEEKFLIADLRMPADDIPTERRFWFDPPFHSGQSALMHRQPDESWRVDLQLGPDANIEDELKPENYTPRIRKMLGDRDFQVDWVSIYRFNCRRIDRFVHDRVVFVGDAAHQVSPFGARGANSGVEDAENLAWKLVAVLRGEADQRLIDSYDHERIQAADENIAHSTRSTDFIAPRSPAERTLRNAVLSLAPHADFARRMVNSGRLSVASIYDTPLSTPDEDDFGGPAKLGGPAIDAAMTMADGTACHLVETLSDGFELLYVDDGAVPVVPGGIKATVIGQDIIDARGDFARRFDAVPGTGYLLRPDQHLCARWRRPTAEKIAAARDRALAR
ncbi:FAD-dependent oxidoreductase [Pseudorhodoplanes sp.]|uniref:FAD-dependent oxidoreductase n=1 Tax=Pseudorhodoplanes sp. TaxID=1934341 RepID=UPI003919825D